MRTWEEAAQAAAEDIPEIPVEGDALDIIDGFLDDLKHECDTGDEVDEDWFRFIADEALTAQGGHRQIVTERVLDLISQKQHDYGHDNVLWGGVAGIVLRMHDKTARIRNLVSRGRQPAHESLTDSWLDLVGYSIIGIMLVRGTFKLPLKRDLPIEVEVKGEYALTADHVHQDATFVNTFLDAAGDEVETDVDWSEYDRMIDAGITDADFDDEDTYDELYDHTLMHFETHSQHVFVGVYEDGFEGGGGRIGIFTRGKNEPNGDAKGAYFTPAELRSLLEYLDACHDHVQAIDLGNAASAQIEECMRVLDVTYDRVVVTPSCD